MVATESHFLNTLVEQSFVGTFVDENERIIYANPGGAVVTVRLPVAES